MDAEALRGHLESLVLAVLEDAPQHGYAVIDAVRLRSGGALALNTGSVYPALRRLERDGFVQGSWGLVDGRRRRTYRLTRAGRGELAASRQRWREFTSVVGGVLGTEEAAS
ncbi:helix-turn-helix transcriptional regulator [Kineococcus glutinatus]|uniref:Helix-turn-helix transcriptional regulator n=1 Tax=Kineococcus glutinatus TaxID=1070872 RepID=A0ABP9H5R6_9ACTN